MENNRISRRQRNRLRHIRQTLAILLPLLVLILVALLIINHKLSDSSKAVLDPAVQTTDDPDTPNPAEDQSDDSISSAPETAPAADELQDIPAIQPVKESKPVTLVFAGDVLLSNYILGNYEHSGIDGILSSQLLAELQNADIAVINNEFPFSTRGTQAPDKQFTFRVDPEYVTILNEMGIDVVSLANNHVLDYGAEALLDTFDTLDHAGISYMGAGTDLTRAKALITKEAGGKTFGFLAASRVIPVISWDIQNAAPGVFTTYDPARLINAIQEAHDHCDYLAVFVHWGVEHEAYPQDYQVTMAQQYIDAGADLVIGAHPHVLQGISYYKDKPVFYSLGNFIFSREIPKTAMIKITLDEEKAPVVQILAASASDARTIACDQDSQIAIYDYLEEISTGISINADGILSQKNE